MKLKGTNGLVVLASSLTFVHRDQIVALAIGFRLPTMNPFRENVTAGGLMSNAASLSEIARQGATYVVKIIRGTQPADLPVERPKKFEFVINLKTARALGLTVPPTLLARADEVIE